MDSDARNPSVIAGGDPGTPRPNGPPPRDEEVEAVSQVPVASPHRSRRGQAAEAKGPGGGFLTR